MVGNILVNILWFLCLITYTVATTQQEPRQLTEGDIIDLKCTDQTFPEKHYIIWYRRSYYTGNKTEIYRNGMLLTSDLGQEALAYSLNNSTEIELTISIARGLGQFLHLNKYECEVIATSSGNKLIDRTDHVLLFIQYPPPAPYPLCTATGYQGDLIGQNVILTCTTQPGNPPISIQWWRNDLMVLHRDISYLEYERFTEHSLNYTFTLQEEDLVAIYQCRVTWMEDVARCTVNETLQSTTTEPDQSTKTNSETRHQTSKNTLITTIFRTNFKMEDSTTSVKFLTMGLSLGAVIVLLLILLIISLLYKRNQMPNNGDQILAGVTEVMDKHPSETEYIYDDVAEAEHVYNNVTADMNKEHVYYNCPRDTVYITTTNTYDEKQDVEDS